MRISQQKTGQGNHIIMAWVVEGKGHFIQASLRGNDGVYSGATDFSFLLAGLEGGAALDVCYRFQQRKPGLRFFSHAYRLGRR
jgi:hypothetical protein